MVCIVCWFNLFIVEIDKDWIWLDDRFKYVSDFKFLMLNLMVISMLLFKFKCFRL